jgi:putative ABC transport system permease protein
MLRRALHLWRNLARRSRVEDGLDEELRAIQELLAAEKRRSGLAPAEAERAARLELGSRDALKDEVRDVRTGASLESLLQDARHSLRLMRRAPAFTAVAVATLALGIGANAAIFVAAKSVLIDALPYADADNLALVYGYRVDGGGWRPLLQARIPLEVVARQRSFQSIAAFDSPRDGVLGGEDTPRLVTIAWVEHNFFSTLGVQAALGRTFREDDRAFGHVPASGAERGPDTARAVLVDHAAWQRLFAGDPAVVGREVRLSGLPRTVIGVLPRGFVGPTSPADFYLAFELAPARNVGAGWLRLVGRLQPGMTHDAAARDVAAAWASRENPQDFKGLAMSAMPLREAIAGRARTPLLLLLGSAALVLLVACANLAGVLLSRALARRRELAVRMALGAGRARLVRQLLVESTMLAVAGGAAGLLLAQLLLRLLRGLAGPVLPAYADLSLDPAGVLVIAVVTLACGLGFGLAPALAVSRSEAQASLRDDARGASEGHRPRRVRGVLVAGQLALSASLLAGASLLGHSLYRMATAPVGIDATGVLSATLRLPTLEYPTLEARTRFREQLLERVRALAGVEQAALANKVPTVNPRTDPFLVEGAPSESTQAVLYASVSDDYFRTLRVPVLAGRAFGSSDREGSPPTAVLGETLARRYWPDGGAVGARVRLGGELVTVVGVVGDVRNDLTLREAQPMAYRSHRQESTQRIAILVRTRGNPLALVKPLERELAALDPTIPLQQPTRLEEAVGQALAPRQLSVVLTTAFSSLALLLATLGVYAMFAGMAAAREREFGIRMALGSRPTAIAGLLLRQGAGWMTAGLVAGVLGILGVIRVLGGLLPGLSGFDPLALGGAVLVLLAAASAALLIPARRAARADPVLALRAE